MVLGKIGGHFDGGIVPYRDTGNLSVISLAGDNTNVFESNLIPFGVGKYIYGSKSTSGGIRQWIRVNIDNEDLDYVNGPSFNNGYVPICGNISGNVHYVCKYNYENSGIQKIDFLTNTVTTLISDNSSGYSKEYIPTLVDNFIYTYQRNLSNRTKAVFKKYDLDTAITTTVEIMFSVANSKYEVKSITRISGRRFYLTTAYSSNTGLVSDTGVNLLLWDEEAGTIQVIAENIPIEYKYGTIMEYTDYTKQHFIAHYTKLEADRIYILMNTIGGSGGNKFPTWAILDIKRKKFIITHCYSKTTIMGVTENDLTTVFSFNGFNQDWKKVYFQKD